MWNLKVFSKKINDVYLILMKKKMQITSIVLDLGTTFMLNQNSNDTIWFNKTCIYKVFNGKNGQVNTHSDIKTSSPKGNDRSPESNVPRSNLISKNI